jgi:hypothetical protein
MGQAKQRKAEIDALKQSSFPAAVVEAWEGSQCIAFAVALARSSGWLLHVDWLVDSRNFDDAQLRMPLRAYVGTDGNDIFDARGVFTIEQFAQQIIQPAATRLTAGTGRTQAGVLTRTYDEQNLSKLLQQGVNISDADIVAAQKLIDSRPQYTARIPRRATPTLPAKDASDFSFGSCVLYAEALREILGLPVVAMYAEEFEANWSADKPEKDGYVHSFALHPDNTAEDSWGRHSIERVAARYHVAAWRLELNNHGAMIENMRANSSKDFEEQMSRARQLIAKYRGGE